MTMHPLVAAAFGVMVMLMLVMVRVMITILMFFVSCATIGKCMASDGKSD